MSKSLPSPHVATAGSSGQAAGIISFGPGISFSWAPSRLEGWQLADCTDSRQNMFPIVGLSSAGYPVDHRNAPCGTFVVAAFGPFCLHAWLDMLACTDSAGLMMPLGSLFGAPAFWTFDGGIGASAPHFSYMIVSGLVLPPVGQIAHSVTGRECAGQAQTCVFFAGASTEGGQ